MTAACTVAVRVAQEQEACSFCWRREDEVARFVRGPNVRICDQCVDLAAGILREADSSETSEFGLWGGA